MTTPDRYPGYHVLDQRGHWDEATRKVVLDRVQNVPEYKHFDGQRRATLEALCARVVPQDNRRREQHVPLAPWIDNLCEQEVLEGFRFDDMPPNSTAWEWGLDGLDQAAQTLTGSHFADLEGDQQDQVLRTVRDGNPPGNAWQRMPARKWWTYVAVRQITGVYYSHPYAWDEIGFGGPAYPRGYFALNHGEREPWEVRDAGDGRSS